MSNNKNIMEDTIQPTCERIGVLIDENVSLEPFENVDDSKTCDEIEPNELDVLQTDDQNYVSDEKNNVTLDISQSCGQNHHSDEKINAELFISRRKYICDMNGNKPSQASLRTSDAMDKLAPDKIAYHNYNGYEKQHCIQKPLRLYEQKYQKKPLYCNNCGKKGHYYNRCVEPNTSIGVIAFNVVGRDDITPIFSDLICYDKNTMMKIKHTNGINLSDVFNSSIENNKDKMGDNIEITNQIRLFNKYLESIKFLMVRRKFTLGFIEFMKAKWDRTNKAQMTRIFSKMAKSEVNLILQNINDSDWINIFDNFWIRDGKINFDKKKEDFGVKFIELRDMVSDDIFEEQPHNLKYYCLNHRDENYPDWGFCKGRREGTERNQETALREMKEESGNGVLLLENLQELKEDIVKEDGNRIRNIYYLGLLSSDARAEYRPELYIAHKSEIGEIGMYTYMDALALIGPHFGEKCRVLTQAYLFIANRLMKYELMQKQI